MSATVDTDKLSPELNRLIFHGVDVLEALAAGMFCLSGMARGAVEPVGRERANQLVTSYDELVYGLRETHKARSCKAATASELGHAISTRDEARYELVDLLSGQVDWRDRALRREDREERDACVLGQYEALVRRLCGPVSPDPSHLAHLVDGLQGSVEATALQRDEQAAFGLMLLDHLRSLPRHEMNEGIENAHHSVCASPRTAESEERSIALLEAQVSVLVLARIRSNIEYAQGLRDHIERQDEERRRQVAALLAELEEARGYRLRLLMLGAVSGFASSSLVYGVVRLLS